MLAGLQRQEFFKGILLLAPLLTLVPGTVPKILVSKVYHVYRSHTLVYTFKYIQNRKRSRMNNSLYNTVINAYSMLL